MVQVFLTMPFLTTESLTNVDLTQVFLELCCSLLRVKYKVIGFIVSQTEKKDDISE